MMFECKSAWASDVLSKHCNVCWVDSHNFSWRGSVPFCCQKFKGLLDYSVVASSKNEVKSKVKVQHDDALLWLCDDLLTFFFSADGHQWNQTPPVQTYEAKTQLFPVGWSNSLHPFFHFQHWLMVLLTLRFLVYKMGNGRVYVMMQKAGVHHQNFGVLKVWNQLSTSHFNMNFTKKQWWTQLNISLPLRKRLKASLLGLSFKKSQNHKKKERSL